MLLEKTNISARVEITLKKIVEDSTFTHKDAYELGAKIIAMGDAEETITLISRNPNYEKIIKQTEYGLIEARKQELERELKDL
ncbi:hypothetical protein [uncultured Methanobrevibacter sp.]|uniref:hypothetical protein n=1 Tax=uncultured Methanobrevibacter sp. TaxID=253161 RepID=UPI0025D26E98|nr:hypothetical protein [uncultured Methanobrevibacter sp.]